MDLDYFPPWFAGTGPGKIGNAFEIGPLDFGSWHESTRQGLNTVQGDFTVRFWYKNEWGLNDAYVDHEDDAGNRWLILSRWGVNGEYFEFSISGDSNWAYVDSEEFTYGPWHLITAYKRGDEIGIRVDNGVNTTAPFVSDALPASSAYLWVAGPLPWYLYICIDELALWKDYAFTDADFDLDWNNGNGRTWPW